MGRLVMLLWILLAIVVVVLGYIRLAPSDPADWNKAPEFDRDKNFKAGVMRVVDTGADGLERLHAVAVETPRTTVLAGTPQDGQVTYITRTKVFGFPDYTTAIQDGDTLKLYARLRFGRADSGVNRRRVEGWLDALKP